MNTRLRHTLRLIVMIGPFALACIWATSTRSESLIAAHPADSNPSPVATVSPVRNTTIISSQSASSQNFIGPVDMPPGGMTISPTLPLSEMLGRAIGKAGGLTLTYSITCSICYWQLYWTAPPTVDFTLNGQSGPYMSFNPQLSDLANGMARWYGGATVDYWTGSAWGNMSVGTRFTVKVTDQFNNPIQMAIASDIGLPYYGLAVTVTGNFTTNRLVEVYLGGVWQPALDWYDSFPTLPTDGLVQSHFNSVGFYYTELQGANDDGLRFTLAGQLGSGTTNAVVGGDLNGDGTLDLVLGNSGQPSQVYWNDGQGNFRSGPVLDSANTYAVAVGDLNGDGTPDLIFGNFGQPSQVYWNDGQGNLSLSAILGSGESTLAVGLGDLNGDGALDAVLGNNQQPSQVYWNDGQGHFSLGPILGSSSTEAVAIGDLNGDGALDLVFGNFGQPSQVYWNDGQGNFNPSQILGSGGNTRAVAVGDLNNDGTLDIVLGNVGVLQPPSGYSQVYYNDGFGNFYSSNLPSVALTLAVSIGDWNGDGALDIIVGNTLDSLNSNSPSQVLLNDGQGRFSQGQTLGNGVYTSAVAVGDWNGDGALDFVLGNNSHLGGPSQIYLNNGQGHFIPGSALESGISSTSAVVAGDLNGDGALDLVLGNLSQPSQTYWNDGQGHFSLGPILNSSATEAVAVGDLNGDGALDIILGYQILVNDGLGHFNTLQPLIFEPRALAVGDLNGDGALDIVSGNGYVPSLVYWNNGQGHFSLGPVLGSGARTDAVAVGDLNGDGALDVILGNFGQPSQVYWNDGQGRLSLGPALGSGAQIEAVAVGDLNSDGAVDIVLGNFGQPSQVYWNDGHGNFYAGSTIGSGATTGAVAVGDLNGDGALDILLGNSADSGPTSQIYWNDKQGNFNSRLIVGIGAPTRAVALGDLNGDGVLDIVLGNGYGCCQPSTIYPNTRSRVTSLPNTPLAVTLSRPGNTRNASFFSSVDILSGTIPVTYMLFDPEGEVSGAIRAFYSPDGGGRWLPATASTDTLTSNLHTTNLFTHAIINATSVPIGSGGSVLDQITSTVIIPSSDGGSEVADVDVFVNISHTLDSDLVITLTAPRSQSVLLVNRRGGSGQDFIDTIFDDQANASIITGTAPFVGRYQPEQPLSTLNGINLAGLWTLTVQDVITPANTGQLNSWGITFTLKGGQVYTYNWNVLADGFFGQSDNVVFRMEAFAVPMSGTLGITGTYRYTNTVPLYRYPYASATTFPFRVRGTQIQVFSDTQPISNAMVYRLPVGQSGGGGAIGLYGQPFRTTSQGFLQGYGQINPGDRLLALSPISSQIQYAGALAFDGIDDYVISNPLGAASITETTVSFWLRSDDRNGQGTPFSYATASNADEFLITNYNDFTIYRGPVSVTTGISATDGLWHHLTITWRSSDGQVKLYKDGVASYTGTLTATSIITGGSFVLGQDQGNVGGGFDPTQAFKGSLDQVHVWNVALDEAGVQHDMLDPLRSDEAGLLLNWSFDVAMDYVVGDQTVHHNDGTLYGATWNGSSLGGYTVYATNGVPTENGLDTFTITQPGVQTLEVTATHPLILFDLDVSLEWDAHNDSSYLPQLTADLKRASEYLYDFSNGQVALGHVTVHQNSDEWLSAHVVVKATNRLRPLAAQGGSISTSTVDPQHADIVYSPGQVRMGATWNRYGDTSGASDWALALAHELSHYLLYQEDTYLGVDSQGRLIPIGSCADSAMGDMYDPRNTEFVYDAAHWQADCADTLANRTLGRTEWATNRLWYPWLITPTVTNTGPALMPFNLTTVTILDPISPTNALADPTFFVRYRESAKASSETQAYLLRTDATGQEYVIDAGSVLVGQNRLIARGAQPGDRLCVVDPARRQFGCEVIEASDAELDLKHDATWAPVIQVSPVNSQTIRIAIEGLTSTLTLRARLYPESGYGGEAITLTQAGGLYTGTFRLDFPAMLGHVQVWVDEPYTELNPRREAIVSFAIGGNLGSWPALRGGWPALRGGWPALRGGWPALRGGWPALRGGWPASRGSAAPLASPGGQMLFFTENPAAIPQDNLYTIQSMAALPPLPTGKKAIGQSYSLIASPNVTQVITGSISFQYLTMEVLVEQADEDQLTIHYRDGRTWRALETIRSAYYNLASAASQGPGVYTLLSGVTTPQVTALDPPAAINDVTTTLTISGQDFLPPVDVWLIGSTTTYTLRVLSVSPVSITAVITQGLTAREYQVRVVNRYDAPSAESLPFALYDPAQACFYDFFESGPSKWLRNGAWDIVTLPNGVHAMTDSPNDNYDNAVAPALTATTSITTTDFDLSGCNRPVLSFRHDYVLAKVGASQDVGHVEVSTDHGATWTTLAAYTGGGPYGAQQRVTRTASDEWLDVQWKPVTIDLSAYTGTIRLRFGLTVDRYIADRGWVIDDVRVAAAPPLRKVYLPILRK